MTFPGLTRLLEILRRLRGPDGCPWDREQTLATAARYLTDEVHEYGDAASADDLGAAQEELADLLYLVAFNWLLLSERSPLDFDDLAVAGAEKLIRRHPHVFGEATAQDAADSQLLWLRRKAAEKKGADPSSVSALKDLSPSSSPLRQASLYGRGAADVGFEWPSPEAALAKIDEELEEVRRARQQGGAEALAEEFGDLLFAVVQAARLLGVDPDGALRAGNRKFARRFRRLEARAGSLEALRALDADALMAAWEQTKDAVEAEDGPDHGASGQPSSSSSPS